MARNFRLGASLDDRLLMVNQPDDRWPQGREGELLKKILIVHAKEGRLTFAHRMVVDDISLLLYTGAMLIVVSTLCLLFIITLSPEHLKRNLSMFAGVAYLLGFIVLILGSKRLVHLQKEHEQGYTQSRVFSPRPYEKN
jgi:hypothetical protein